MKLLDIDSIADFEAPAILAALVEYADTIRSEKHTVDVFEKDDYSIVVEASTHGGHKLTDWIDEMEQQAERA